MIKLLLSGTLNTITANTESHNLQTILTLKLDQFTEEPVYWFCSKTLSGGDV